MELDYKAIGKRIKIARIKKNLTQEAIADKIGITPQHVSNIETGNASVSLTTLVAIANTLTVSVNDLLYFLYLHKGQVFTKEQLYENVWGFEDMPKDTSNLPSFIRKLRKKIEPDPDNPIYIITVWGVGYKFSEEKP